MGRKIELEFYNKKYIIEYNRASVLGVVSYQGKNDIEQVVNLIKCGLTKNHKNELPSDDEIKGWLIAMGEDINEFANALREMVQDVLNTFQEDRKNLKWAKVEA